LLPGFEREFSNAKAAKSAYSYRRDSGNLAESNAQSKSTALREPTDTSSN
jgi:hypothetical protein